MCGIAVAVGRNPDLGVFSEMMETLLPRGETDERLIDAQALLGTQRLHIVDRDRAIQPWLSSDGRWALCYNGEIFNFRQLRAELLRQGTVLRSESDTEIVLEAFLQWGPAAAARFRGEFAFVIYDRHTRRTFIARDPVGVKPLYWALSDATLYLASEIKALTGLATRIWEVPPGCTAWAEPEQPPEMEAYVNLLEMGNLDEPIYDVDHAKVMVRSALEDAVDVRIDTDLTVGVILSGGLDSTLTLLRVREKHPDCVAFTIGSPESEDIKIACRVARDLQVEHCVLEVSPSEIGYHEIAQTVRAAELTEYGDVINAVITNRLFTEIRRSGIKVVLSGDGSDELFGGYDMYSSTDEVWRQRLFQHTLRNLCRTELQRVDRTSMGHGVECRVPFLDLEVVRLAMRLPIDLKVRDGEEKWVVREAFADVLPPYVRLRRKNPLSHSSGLHERVRIFRWAFPRVYRAAGYQHLQPMRRDFSVLLERHALDLDATLDHVNEDYTWPEQLRDAAGALRWNLQRRCGR